MKSTNYCIMLLLFSPAIFAETECLVAPKQVSWEKDQSATATLCGYKQGALEDSYIELINIPKKLHQGCLQVTYEPLDNDFYPEDTLTLYPNEGVELNKNRSPIILEFDDKDGPQTKSIPLKTDGVKDAEYGLSVSGQSSSVNVNVKIEWQHSNPDCDEASI